ncbi:MAG TPA: hypothetical protein VF730_08730 [Terracidiphilus sp.]
MRADRTLLASAIFLGAGLFILLRYGATGAEFATAMPWSSMGFHLNLADTGPAAIGGAALVAVGLLLLLWSILAALAFNVSLLFDRNDDRDFLRILPSSSSEVEAQDDDDDSSEPLAGHRRFL